MHRTKLAGLGWGSAVTGLALAVSCGGSDHPFNGASPTEAGSGGADDETSAAGSGAAGSGVSGTACSVAQGGQPDSGAGAPSMPAGGDAAGAPPVMPTAECPDGYSDWLTSSFAFPDGDVIGTADFPSMPWAKSGTLAIDTGRLSGAGAAIVSQGTTFPYAGSRFRFRTRFTDSNQEVTAAFDAAKDGTGGVRIEVDGFGRLSLTEGKVVVAFTDLAPLDTGVDWFVEAIFKDTSATITLARSNYGSEKKADIQATLETDALKVNAAGAKTALTLASTGGIAPAVDELAFARCGVAPPDYGTAGANDHQSYQRLPLGQRQLQRRKFHRQCHPSSRILDVERRHLGLRQCVLGPDP
jgi:hypothetical protein